MRSKSGLKTALASTRQYIRHIFNGRLYLEKSNLGTSYEIMDGRYAIFRETHCKKVQGESVILIIGFRMKLVRRSRIANWFFQRVCVITTPFWSGLSGFKVKLWMVNPETKEYLGIYDWRGRTQAEAYINYLMPILKFFSVRGSIWNFEITGQNFDQFLHDHEVRKTARRHERLKA
jgi:hypothetical protein